MGYQVPLMLASPNMEAKSQYLSLKRPLKIRLITIKVGTLIILCKILAGLVLRVGYSFLLDPTVNTVPSLTSNTPQKRVASNAKWDLGHFTHEPRAMTMKM